LKISIITAVYNREDTIERALLSLKLQTYPDIEGIVVDGNSSDTSLKIIKSLQLNKLKIISEPDDGLYDALNKGLSFVTGDIVGFLHSDDIFYDNNVLSVIASIFEDDSIDVVYGDSVFFTGCKTENYVRRYKSGILSKSRLSWGWMPAHPAMFIRKRVYEKIGNFKTTYLIAADYEFLCRMMSALDVNIVYYPYDLMKMQTGGASAGGLKNTILLNREVLRACRENGIYSNLVMLLSKYPIKLLQFLVR
jgi:glycosyltransferase involved in cell wall biosynthesis